MRQRLLILLPLALFMVLGGFFLAGLGRDPKVLPSALLDQPVPDFDLPALIPEKGGLASADLVGGVTVVNVFASWCVPCRVEHPLWMRLAEDGDVRMRLVGLNYKDRPQDARGWLTELGDPYTRIGTDADGRVGIDWGVYGVPETFVIDPTGRIRYKHVGPMTEATWTDVIHPLVRSLQP
ncbi:MAG: DsbE family thiol:disulfide interchange protein [Alphaproteobacteria bacterium]|nr:DsbE family thiol:disulfide interchange protein [Alphaproteobacteria bacterium]